MTGVIRFQSRHCLVFVVYVYIFHAKSVLQAACMSANVMCFSSGRLHNSVRGLHQFGDGDQVHDGRYVAT